MFRVVLFFIYLMASFSSWAETATSSVSLLDNRFRVDPTIKQISFVIYRESPSRSVVLVRPDGEKYYAWEHPESVSWYEENGMDIVSIESPMPGPWQAVGKVTPKNNIKLLSNLKLHVDSFPSRLYQNEKLKFTARLTQEGKPLVLQDFLDRVKLSVKLIKYVEDEDNPELNTQPEAINLGDFEDDGKNLDEISGDGVFTVDLPISVSPGKYRARITSENGVFLRAVEQTVLIYPSPITVNFTQAKEETEPHMVTVIGEAGMILPGTLAVSVEQTTPDKQTITTQSSVARDELTTDLLMPNDRQAGKHIWKGTVYATEGAARRELVLQIQERAFSVMAKLDIEQSTKEYQRIQEEKRRLLEIERIKRDREEARMTGMLTILVGNLVVIVLGLLIWFIIGKLRARKAAVPTMQLDAPPKS
ncbi:TIGR03503 family protein [Vibrio sp. TH_r3]|uniref:TIGR03503 family protein n=1 Tax=Vibrio sp. TH_r3 TaxID=3082084 RepID=UPI0029556744|nr:TIGR03503 family protein [Vibrio sp. TH_r3]MDV7105059.1 TIGR03503 family protein [Vibrio sp. TH_r3]